MLGFIPMLFTFLFILKQQSVRQRMKGRLEEEMLHTINLADHEVRWVEDGKEIMVDGRMFDVKSVEYLPGRIIFHGLFDDEETALNKTFGENWKKKSLQQSLLLAHLFKCLRGFYFDTADELIFQLQKQEHITVLSSPRLLSQFKPILTPPPQA